MSRRQSSAAFLSLFLSLAVTRSPAQADSQWVLDASTLSYRVTHPMHEIEGVTHQAKGKGTCHAGKCALLVAVPVKSFDSGDSNRDLHMIEVTRGAQFPMAIVRVQFAQSDLSSAAIHADLEVQFAGQTAHYSQVAFERTQKGNDVQITGTIPLTCSDVKIDRPSFLTIPIRNEIPVKVDMTWQPM